MSVLYNFLTTDPEVDPKENLASYYKRVSKRRAIQRLIIRSFPREFQQLDERLFNESMHRAAGDKNGIIAGGIATFTGRERLARAMVNPIRTNLEGLPPNDPNELKALEWIKLRRYQPLV